MKLILATLIFALVPLSSGRAASITNDVSVDYGTVRGYSEGDTYSYLGVPFVKAPVGPLRWQKPQAITEKNKLVQAFSSGLPCRQAIPLVPLGPLDPIFKTQGSEDCLHLNIWAPKKGKKKPVLFFIHGGAHAFGSNSEALYRGKHFAETEDVVIVNTNYRLGPLGYMAYKDEVPANLAIHDLIASLKWVKSNIEGFGGDPDNITIFGESAGGGLVFSLLASPLAKGLFHKAIAQSGHPIETPVEKAHEMADYLIKKFRCLRANSPIDCLRRKLGSDIVDAVKVGGLDNELHIGPVYGDEVLPRSVFETFERGEQNKVPTIIGSNNDEMLTLLPLFFQGKVKDEAQYREVLKSIYPNAVEEIVTHYPPSKYSDLTSALRDVLGDSLFHTIARGYSEALASTQSAPVHRYVYDFVSDNMIFKEFLAGHGMELLHLFGNYPLLTHPIGPSELERSMNLLLMRKWADFARTGQAWDPYVPTEDNYLWLNQEPNMDKGYRANHCNFWLRMRSEGKLPL